MKTQQTWDADLMLVHYMHVSGFLGRAFRCTGPINSCLGFSGKSLSVHKTFD